MVFQPNSETAQWCDDDVSGNTLAGLRYHTMGWSASFGGGHTRYAGISSNALQTECFPESARLAIFGFFAEYQPALRRDRGPQCNVDLGCRWLDFERDGFFEQAAIGGTTLFGLGFIWIVLGWLELSTYDTD